MKLGKKVDARKLILIIGTTLLLFADNLPWVWGNLVPYVDSYFRVTFGLENYGGTTWAIPLNVGLYPVGSAASDVLVKRVGLGWTILAGIFLYDFSVMLSYFTVQHSVEALVVTTGAIPGCGSGFLYGLALYIISSFKSKYSGVLIAIVTSGMPGGSLLTNEIMSHYINPNNESPNLTVVTVERSESYFTQQNVIDRVPSSFLVLAGTCFTIHLLGSLPIMSVYNKVILKASSNNKDVKNDKKGLAENALSTTSPERREKSRLLANSQYKPQRYSSSNSLHSLIESEVSSASGSEHGHRKRSLSFNDRYSDSCTDIREISGAEKQGDVALVAHICSSNDKDVNEEHGSKIRGKTFNSSQADFTTLQMIKTPVFYVLFLSYTSGDLSYITVQNYYKLYGQNYIKDDHFITDVSTLTVIAAIISRLGFGVMMDFHGVKYTLIFFQSSLIIISQMWYFAPMVNKWVYMILTTCFRSLAPIIYVIFSAATLALFGKTYFARNVSVLMFLGLAVNLSGPLILEVLLRDFGWYSISLVCSLVNFSGLCAVLILFPRV